VYAGDGLLFEKQRLRVASKKRTRGRPRNWRMRRRTSTCTVEPNPSHGLPH